MNRRARSRLLAAVASSALLAGIGAGAVGATTPPDGESLFVIELDTLQPTTDPPADTVDEPAPAPAAARPTPFVVAQHLVELEAGRSLQWQVTPVQLGAAETPLAATANLFVVTDDPLVLGSESAPLGSVLAADDEVVAVPTGSRWVLRAPAGSATVTIFGLGHEQGGTAPAGEPFAPAAGGVHQLEVRGYQLLPGEHADVGDDSPATLLIGRQGAVTVADTLLGAGDTLTTTRTTVTNEGDDIAVFLAATVTPVAEDADLTVPDGPTTAPPQATSAPQATGAPPATAAPTAPPSTDPPTSPPTANDDVAASTGGNPVSMNVMNNDDRGNPPAVVVSVDGSASNVGVPYNPGPATFVMNADGSATFSVALAQPGATYTYSVVYVIENAHGQSSAVATFSIEG